MILNILLFIVMLSLLFPVNIGLLPRLGVVMVGVLRITFQTLIRLYRRGGRRTFLLIMRCRPTPIS